MHDLTWWHVTQMAAQAKIPAMPCPDACCRNDELKSGGAPDAARSSALPLTPSADARVEVAAAAAAAETVVAAGVVVGSLIVVFSSTSSVVIHASSSPTTTQAVRRQRLRGDKERNKVRCQIAQGSCSRE